eukprot:365810-Chlamydomonas_euryale.AAC.14
MTKLVQEQECCRRGGVDAQGHVEWLTTSGHASHPHCMEVVGPNVGNKYRTSCSYQTGHTARDCQSTATRGPGR